MKSSTEYCKDFLSKTIGGEPKEWKRGYRITQCSTTIRWFSHSVYGNLTVFVDEERFDDDPTDERTIWVKENIEKFTLTYDRFSPMYIDKECTGRVIFYVMTEEDEDNFTLWCGAEMNGGYLDDQHNSYLYEVLRKLLKGYKTEIGACESNHIIYFNEGKLEETIESVSNILKDAGAIELERR